MNPLVVQAAVKRRSCGWSWRGEVTDRLTVRPQIWASTAAVAENNRWQAIFPPLRSMCCVPLLCKWAKTVHIRNLTPSYGQNSDVQSSWCKHGHLLYLHRHWEWASPCGGDVAERGITISLIGGTRNQSESCPSVRCQTFRSGVCSLLHLPWLTVWEVSHHRGLFYCLF